MNETSEAINVIQLLQYCNYVMIMMCSYHADFFNFIGHIKDNAVKQAQ